MNWSRAAGGPLPLMLWMLFLTGGVAAAAVPTGDEAKARKYYQATSKTLAFATPDTIFETTLDEVAAYVGYGGLSGRAMQDLDSAVLMQPSALLGTCSSPGKGCLTEGERLKLLASLGPVPPGPDDILVSRFFAPKIMNILEPEAKRELGWRKLVRLRARPGSAAEAHQISSAIILFNFFTPPGVPPFGPGLESVNTQVMLVTDLKAVQAPGKKGPDTLYWLDYDKLSNGGKLSFALTASFDANELPHGSSGAQPYFVPDGCNACHGITPSRQMVNYLDTDHWFDRLDNDFPALKASGLALVFDAKTNDTNAPEFRLAFDVIRRFNEEADIQARKAQPAHDEGLAATRWLELHATSNDHFQPAERALRSKFLWSQESEKDVAALGILNQYCFRCHGTVKFSVFNKEKVKANKAGIVERVQPSAENVKEVGFVMPPDRPIPPNDLKRLLETLP